MGSLRTRRAFREVCSMRAEAVCALLRDRAGFAAMAVLSTALTGRLSVAAMSSMKVPALVALAGHAWFVDVSGESARAEESPRSLRRFEEGHNKCLTRKVIRIVPASADANGYAPGLAGDLVFDGYIVVDFGGSWTRRT